MTGRKLEDEDRQMIENAVETIFDIGTRLITILDAADGDPDREPSLSGQYPCYSCPHVDCECGDVKPRS
jgi:hypothetical protein